MRAFRITVEQVQEPVLQFAAGARNVAVHCATEGSRIYYGVAPAHNANGQPAQWIEYVHASAPPPSASLVCLPRAVEFCTRMVN